ncbi:MAG: hypothetical protein KGJ51_12810 [Acidobacteriota bacterium]|nr:hypothetical protein [Acidobacteriota bacterium]
MKLIASIFVLAYSIGAYSQQLQVKIIDRQDHEADYSYVVPGYFNSNSSASANCTATDNSASCNANSSTQGYSTPPQFVPYHVSGATLTLLLPDGRGAIVNCESKFAEHFAGPRGNHRSCLVPLVTDIEADFHGDKAKLEWVVSLDGKKKQSETYKVLAILEKPTGGKN